MSSTHKTIVLYPDYLYKILLPSDSQPLPLPQALGLSALDAQDGFIHLSTSRQVLSTLNHFFSAVSFVFILRIPYSRVEKYIRWEDPGGRELGEFDHRSETGGLSRFFPHLYPNFDDSHVDHGLKLGRDEIDEFAMWEKNGCKWDAVGWPFVEDIPK